MTLNVELMKRDIGGDQNVSAYRVIKIPVESEEMKRLMQEQYKIIGCEAKTS